MFLRERGAPPGTWDALSRRGVQTQGSTLELPASRMNSLSEGLELLWKL